MRNGWKVPFVMGGLARLVICGGYLFVPEWMGGRLAPRIDGHAGARMNLRGMGGTQTGVALYTLARARNAESARTALSLNLLVDGLDLVVSSFLEWRDRGKVDAWVAGDIAVNGTFVLCYSAAAVLLRQR
jgi:hypothetical protein